MAIEGEQTAPNYGTGNYFRINRIEINCAPPAPEAVVSPQPCAVVNLGLYASKAAREVAPGQPIYPHSLRINIEDMVAAGYPDPRAVMYNYLLNHHPMFKDTNAVSDEQPETAPSEPVQPTGA